MLVRLPGRRIGGILEVQSPIDQTSELNRQCNTSQQDRSNNREDEERRFRAHSHARKVGYKFELPLVNLHTQDTSSFFEKHQGNDSDCDNHLFTKAVAYS